MKKKQIKEEKRKNEKKEGETKNGLVAPGCTPIWKGVGTNTAL